MDLDTGHGLRIVAASGWNRDQPPGCNYASAGWVNAHADTSVSSLDVLFRPDLKWLGRAGRFTKLNPIQETLSVRAYAILWLKF